MFHHDSAVGSGVSVARYLQLAELRKGPRTLRHPHHKLLHSLLLPTSHIVVGQEYPDEACPRLGRSRSCTRCFVLLLRASCVTQGVTIDIDFSLIRVQPHRIFIKPGPDNMPAVSPINHDIGT